MTDCIPIHGDVGVGVVVLVGVGVIHLVDVGVGVAVGEGVGEAVGVAMRDWEESRRMPIMSIWCSHPSNFDSLRTYVWAQKQFRLKVEVVAHHRLSDVSSIGTYLDAKPGDTSFNLKPTPVEELIDWIRQEYKDHLGIFPITG